MNSSAIVVDPEILNGMPCIAGTQVTVQLLFDYLDNGHPLSDFLDEHPEVTAEQANRVLVESGRM